MKQKTVRLALIIFVVIACLLIATHIFLSLSLGPPWQSLSEMERDFDENSENILMVRDYLSSIEHDFLRYPTFSGERDGMMSTGISAAYVEIENESVRDAMELLINQGYRVIMRDGNFIIFIRWSNMDNGRGIVYSIDGTFPDNSIFPFLTRLEPLPKSDWFYYEEDFNEFRKLTEDSESSGYEYTENDTNSFTLSWKVEPIFEYQYVSSCTNCGFFALQTTRMNLCLLMQ